MKSTKILIVIYTLQHDIEYVGWIAHKKTDEFFFMEPWQKLLNFLTLHKNFKKILTKSKNSWARFPEQNLI